MNSDYQGPYDKDKCHFCGKSDKTHPTESAKNVAGFQRQEGETFTGPFFDSCQGCLRKLKGEANEIRN